MAVELNHTIIDAVDKKKSATFMADILGLPAPEEFSHFLIVRTSNNVSLDFLETTDKIETQHYAFLVSEKEFDQIFGRITDRGLPYWADPQQTKQGEINHHDGGRGVYFEDPSGHLLEIITRPYGSQA
ncbi:VOC family protein [Nitrospina watsonii]|uniref:Glyoxalase/bleomycin resistance protein/dioxygenase n=1 Tax=Nitrospina watsonii TaxID=1323948 RepID=A0ABM9HAC7_9BACT|nr:VOC family protein [Nitrospina watsonii]CAI2717097.1 Glyoxalase/bleomycin resistance protein/dioxygenase [Nitrospina watsonii]